MKKTLPLLIFVFFSSIIFAQLAKPSSAISHKSIENNTIKTPNELVIPDGTICFTEKGKTETILMTKTSFICSIKQFTSVLEAEAYAKAFKKSDSNVSDFSYISNKDGLFSFNFSIKEPKEAKWYLQLFKNNNLQFVKNNKNINAIDELLSK